MKKPKWVVKIKFIYLFLFIVSLSVPMPAMATITGYINNIDGDGINGAIITASTPDGDFTATTAPNDDGKDGYYSLPLSGGGYDITITADDYKDIKGYWKYKTTRDYSLSPIQEYFVSPDGGSEFNPGTKEAPFATLEDAQKAIRAIAESEWIGVEVYLRGKPYVTDGIYYRENSFVLELEDSGTAEAPVVYKAYPGEEVRIAGGVKLDWNNFTVVTDSNIVNRLDVNVQGKVYQISLSHIAENFGELKRRSVDPYYGRYGVGATDEDGNDIEGNPILFTPDGIYPPAGPLEIFINQEPGLLARWPDKKADNDDLVKTQMPVTGQREDNTIEFTNLRKWSGAPDPWFQGFWKANYIDMQSRGTINDINYTIQLDVEVRKESGELIADNKFKIGERFFYVKNLLEEITQEGEWYLDRNSGILYIYPYSSLSDTYPFESMGGKEIMVSTLGDSLLVLKGASNLKFENITFEISRGELVSIHNDPGDPEDVTDDIVSTDNLFYNCVLRNSYYSGAVVYGIRNKFEHSTIYNTGDMGVWLVGGDLVTLARGDNEISNSKIFKTSRWRMSFVPGIRIKGVGQIISHNDLYDMPGSAIFGGSVENRIEYNDISNVLQYGQDVAALYLGGGYHKRGNVIQFNHFHDIQPNILGTHTEENVGPNRTEETDKTAHFSFGIYIDDVHSGATVKGNVFNNIAGAALFHGGGRDNTMENNIMVNCGAAFWTDNRGMNRVISPHACEDRDSYPGECDGMEYTYDMFLATQLGTGEFVHIKSPWAATYPLLAVMPTTWEEVRDGDWRQPEGNTFQRNVGVIPDGSGEVNPYDYDSIFYFAKSEKVHPYEVNIYGVNTIGRPLRGFTYPLNYFLDIDSARDPEDVFLEFENDKNNFGYTAIDLAPTNGIISITDSGFLFDDIPIGEMGTDWE